MNRWAATAHSLPGTEAAIISRMVPATTVDTVDDKDPHQGPGLLLLIALWLLGAAGLVLLGRHDVTPGPAGQAPTVWPGDSAIPRTPSGTQLLMFIHPMCPCSRASLSELTSVMAELGGRATVTVVLMKEEATGRERGSAEVVALAERIPGAAVVLDQSGAESRRFGARTSGHVVAYDAGNRLVFSGGITGSRGHTGDNMGRRRLIDAVTGPRPSAGGEARAGSSSSPTFGCEL